MCERSQPYPYICLYELWALSGRVMADSQGSSARSSKTCWITHQLPNNPYFAFSTAYFNKIKSSDYSLAEQNAILELLIKVVLGTIGIHILSCDGRNPVQALTGEFFTVFGVNLSGGARKYIRDWSTTYIFWHIFFLPPFLYAERPSSSRCCTARMWLAPIREFYI